MEIKKKFPSLVFLLILATTFLTVPVVQAQNGPKTPNMLIHIYSDPTAEFSAFEACDIDIVDWPLTAQLTKKWSDSPYNTYIKMHHYNAFDDFDLDLNNQRWPTGVTEPRTYDPATGTYKHYYGSSVWDATAKEFRKGLAYLTDKDDTAVTQRSILGILGGYGYRKDTPVPIPALAGWTDYNDLRTKGLIYDYDPFKAAITLDNAGFVQGVTSNPYYDPSWPASAPKIRTDPRYGGDLAPLVFYIRTDDPNRLAVGNMITDELRKAGIQVDARLVPKTMAYREVEILYDYHLYTGGWTLTPDIDYLYHLFHSSMYWGGDATSYYGGLGWSPNYPGVANYDYDNWAEQLKYATTFADAYTAALKAQEVLAEYVATIPLWSSAGVKAYKAGWEDTVSLVGECKDNYWSFLNMYNPTDNTIDWGFSNNLEGLNVITAEWQWDRKALRLIYDSLLDRNPYNLAEDFGWLARSWTTGLWTPSMMYVLFKLRPNAMFHDGSPVTPQDVKFSLEFTRDCGIGVAWTNPIKNGGTWWTHSNLKNLDHVNTQIEEPTLGPLEVKVYFNVVSYWALHWAGFIPIIKKDLWMTANTMYGWGYGTANFNPLLVRQYEPWNVDLNGNGDTDLKEDGSGAWVYQSATPLPIQTSTSIYLTANTNFYLSQAYLSAYKIDAFHRIGNINYPGSYFESTYISMGFGIDQIIDMVDRTLMVWAYGTSSSDPWGVGPGFYNPDADLNNDGIIDYRDNSIWAVNYGRHSNGQVVDIIVKDPSLERTIVGEGLSIPVDFNVTVVNERDGVWSFNVNAYYNDTLIGTQYVDLLASGASKTLTFTWDTTGVAKGSYTISAEAERLPCEVDGFDNKKEVGTVIVTIPGDITGPENPIGSGKYPPDGVVNSYDLVYLGKKFGTSDPVADFTGPENPVGSRRYPPDGVVNSYDLFELGKNYGKHI